MSFASGHLAVLASSCPLFPTTIPSFFFGGAAMPCMYLFIVSSPSSLAGFRWVFTIFLDRLVNNYLSLCIYLETLAKLMVYSTYWTLPLCCISQETVAVDLVLGSISIWIFSEERLSPFLWGMLVPFLWPLPRWVIHCCLVPNDFPILYPSVSCFCCLLWTSITCSLLKLAGTGTVPNLDLVLGLLYRATIVHNHRLMTIYPSPPKRHCPVNPFQINTNAQTSAKTTTAKNIIHCRVLKNLVIPSRHLSGE